MFKLFDYLISFKLNRRIILIVIDVVNIIFSFFIAINFLPEVFLNSNMAISSGCLYFVILGILIFISTNHYKGITRAIGSQDVYLLSLRTLVLVISVYFLLAFFNKEIPDQKFFILVWLFITISIGATRFIIRDILFITRRRKKEKKISVVIYGAGSAGAQLANSLLMDGNYKIVFFIDDDISLSGRSLKGIPIINLDKFVCLPKIEIDHVLMAIPSLNKKKFNSIVSKLYGLNLKVLRVPSLNDLTSGRAKIDNLSPISIYDLLSRQNVNYIKELYGPTMKSKCICITGAGGSIGSELSIQIFKLKPSSLVLIDHDEFSLYKLNQKLIKEKIDNVELFFRLGSATNKKFIFNTFKELNVDIVFHAAAYKHVPIVECNKIQGLLNNIYSTYNVCSSAEKLEINNVILVSSDKAVRPTNVMGASKRVSELIIQAYAYEQKINKRNEKISKKFTSFSMVRFGNVLNSSGSVVPLFKEQIDNGGPITITHKNVQRYFMTISEAAELLIQTVELSEGGDLFLLDMGKPVFIKDLAEQMIRLSGLKLKKYANDNGDIEIIYKGLREGEKLYEELLIDSNSEETIHPLIFRAHEKYIKPEVLFKKIKTLHEFLLNQNEFDSLKVLKELVPEWKNK